MDKRITCTTQAPGPQQHGHIVRVIAAGNTESVAAVRANLDAGDTYYV